MCDYCAFFLRKREHDSNANILSVTCPLWSVGNYSGPGTVQDWFNFAHNTSEMLRADEQKYLTVSAKTNKNKCK